MSARLLFCLLLSLIVLFVLGSSRPASASPPIITPHSPDWDPACYSNYAQIDTFLHNQVSQYPQIATLLDGGLAWEGTRHIWALKLTSVVHPDPKPGLFLLAGQHPRDIATTEMLLRFVTYLTQSYGTDPDVTWLLDNRIITIIPTANPDGYVQVPLGLNQFKNRDNNYCSNSINRGADINRNYPFQWNTVGGSPLTCDLSYPGPAALSEPESSAILSLLSQVPSTEYRVPSASLDKQQAATNANYSVLGTRYSALGNGLLINLQATGPGILYPWGYTPTPPPDAPGLFALGQALGRLNGTPPSEVRTENSHVPISGIIDDTVRKMLPVALEWINRHHPVREAYLARCVFVIPV
jgi:carboxypeptidase T